MHTPLRTKVVVYTMYHPISSFNEMPSDHSIRAKCVSFFHLAFATLWLACSRFRSTPLRVLAPVSLSIFLPFCDCASRTEAYGINEWASERMFAFTICHGSFSLWLFVYYISLAFCKCKASWVSSCFFSFASSLFSSLPFLSIYLRSLSVSSSCCSFSSLTLFCGALSSFSFKIECWMADVMEERKRTNRAITINMSSKWVHCAHTINSEKN